MDWISVAYTTTFLLIWTDLTDLGIPHVLKFHMLSSRCSKVNQHCCLHHPAHLNQSFVHTSSQHSDFGWQLDLLLINHTREQIQHLPLWLLYSHPNEFSTFRRESLECLENLLSMIQLCQQKWESGELSSLTKSTSLWDYCTKALEQNKSENWPS